MNERLRSVSQDALSLDVEERAALLERLWDSLVDQPDRVHMPNWHRSEIERRQAAHAANPEAATPWEVALDRIEATSP
jgi:putative addiction module component (TIGR02574 family)